MTLEAAREDLVKQSSLDVELYKGTTLDNDGNAVAVADELADLLSRACQWWAKLTYCCYDPRVSLVLTIGTDSYDLRDRTLVSAKVLRPRTVVVNDVPLVRADGKQYGLWTMEQLQARRSTWRTLDDGTPDVAVWLPTNALLLSVPPSAVYTGKNFIEAWTIPDVLTLQDDGDELPVPEEDHPSIVRLAVAFGSLPNLSDGEAWQRAATMDAWWKQEAERRKRENVNAFLGRRPRGDRAREWIYG